MYGDQLEQEEERGRGRREARTCCSQSDSFKLAAIPPNLTSSSSSHNVILNWSSEKRGKEHSSSFHDAFKISCCSSFHFPRWDIS